MKRKLNMKKVLVAVIVLLLLIACPFALFNINRNDVETMSTVQYEQVIEDAIDTNTNDTMAEPSLDTQEETPQIEPVTMYTTTGVNMRMSPSLEGQIVKVLPVNTQITKVADVDSDWSKIKYEDNEEYYYISSKYISTEKTVVKVQEKQKVTTRSSNSARTETVTNSTQGNLVGYFKLTAYCGCSKCCGKSTGITASGTKATAGRTIAASSQYSFGTKLVINGHTYTVEDRGGAIKGNKIDIYFNSHSEALAFGVKNNVPVYYAQ